MKKSYLMLTLILTISIAFILSGCFLFNTPKTAINGSVVNAQITNEGVEFTSNVEAQGIEVTVNMEGIKKEDVSEMPPKVIQSKIESFSF